MPAFSKHALAAGFCMLQLLSFAPSANSADTRNLTGLPAYPNLTSALMDGYSRPISLDIGACDFGPIHRFADYSRGLVSKQADRLERNRPDSRQDLQDLPRPGRCQDRARHRLCRRLQDQPPKHPRPLTYTAVVWSQHIDADVWPKGLWMAPNRQRARSAELPSVETPGSPVCSMERVDHSPVDEAAARIAVADIVTADEIVSLTRHSSRRADSCSIY